MELNDIKTKEDLLSSILKGVFNSTSVSVPYSDGKAPCFDKTKYHISRAKLNKDGFDHYEKVFNYVFKSSSPQDSNSKLISKPEYFRNALSWLNEFFNLGIDPNSLIKRNNRNLTEEWGSRIYDCYIELLDIIFVGSNDGRNDPVNCEEIRNTMTNYIKETLGIDTPAVENMVYEFVDASPSQLDKLYRKISAATQSHEPEDFLKQAHYSLPNRKNTANDNAQTYTYEDLNEDVDYANKVLNEMPDELDYNLRFRLYRYIGELRDKIWHFRYNLSLEKKQYTISILKTTKERFFKDSDTTLPPKESFDSEEESRTRFDYARAYSDLEMCIRALKQLIDYETKSKKD